MANHKDKEDRRHLYLNYPRLVENYEKRFGLNLSYRHPNPAQKDPLSKAPIPNNPAVIRGNRLEGKEVRQNRNNPQTSGPDIAPLEDVEAFNTLQLPLPFKLMVAKMIELLLTEEFGEITLETFKGKKAGRYTRLVTKVKSGTSHQIDITPEDRAALNEWCAAVARVLLFDT